MAQNETVETANTVDVVSQSVMRAIASQINVKVKVESYQRLMVCSVSPRAGKSTVVPSLARQLHHVTGESWEDVSFETWLTSDELPTHHVVDGFSWSDKSAFLSMDHQKISKIDGIIFVCMMRQCDKQELDAMLKWCASVEVPVLGVVLNHYKNLPLRQRFRRIFKRFRRAERRQVLSPA